MRQSTRNRYARKHLRVSRQRKEYCKRVAYCVIQSNDLVAYEDLKVANMVNQRGGRVPRHKATGAPLSEELC